MSRRDDLHFPLRRTLASSYVSLRFNALKA